MYYGAGVGKLPNLVCCLFLKTSFLGTQPGLFIDVLSTLQQQSRVVARETMRLTKPKVLTIWPFIKSLPTPDTSHKCLVKMIMI